MGRINISGFVEAYIRELSLKISIHNPSYRLSSCQSYWLGFCLTGILLSNEINWSQYSRLSFGYYKISALSWMFRHSKVNFELLLSESIRHILTNYGIRSGSIVFDDTDNERSKNAVHIHGLGKQKDKKSGGYFLGQNILFMLLVTDKVTIPIGFKFYENDPSWLKWKKEDDTLRSKKVKKANRAEEPLPDYKKYPTKQMLCIQLTANFKANFPDFKVISIMADCFFGTFWYKELDIRYFSYLSKSTAYQPIEIKSSNYLSK